MYYVYIIKSLSGKHYYIGHSENVQGRLLQHNTGYVKSTGNSVYGRISIPNRRILFVLNSESIWDKNC